MTADMIRKDAALKGYDTALSILNNAINAVSEAKAIVLQYGSGPEQRWIPCSEGLPEHDGEKYLVTLYSDRINVVSVRISYCYMNRDGFWSDVPVGYKVTAWMPLPEPYNGEREGTE